MGNAMESTDLRCTDCMLLNPRGTLLATPLIAMVMFSTRCSAGKPTLPTGTQLHTHHVTCRTCHVTSSPAGSYAYVQVGRISGPAYFLSQILLLHVHRKRIPTDRQTDSKHTRYYNTRPLRSAHQYYRQTSLLFLLKEFLSQ